MKRMEFAPRMMEFMLKNAGDPCAYGEYGCARAGARRAGSGARFGVNVMNLYPKMMNLYLEMVGFCAENDGFCAGDRSDQGDARLVGGWLGRWQATPQPGPEPA